MIIYSYLQRRAGVFVPPPRSALWIICLHWTPPPSLTWTALRSSLTASINLLRGPRTPPPASASFCEHAHPLNSRSWLLQNIQLLRWCHIRPHPSQIEPVITPRPTPPALLHGWCGGQSCASPCWPQTPKALCFLPTLVYIRTFNILYKKGRFWRYSDKKNKKQIKSFFYRVSPFLFLCKNQCLKRIDSQENNRIHGKKTNRVSAGVYSKSRT